MPCRADFNFAAPQASHPLFAWLLLLAGILAGVVVADRHDTLDEEHAILTRQIERLERKFKPPMEKRAPAAQKSAQVGRHETTAFPWDIVLREIEFAFDAREIALLNLDTDTVARRTRLDAEARGIDDALEFAERLRDIPLVRRVLLLAHETKKVPTGAVTGFTLQIEWDID